MTLVLFHRIRVYDVVVKKLTFAISSPYEFLLLNRIIFCSAKMSAINNRVKMPDIFTPLDNACQTSRHGD